MSMYRIRLQLELRIHTCYKKDSYYHIIGNLLLPPNILIKFLQAYGYDLANELQNE